MNRRNARTLPLVSLLAAAIAGCAGTPPDAGTAYEEEALRETDNDVLFATEFPVASKADALLRAREAQAAGDLDRALFFYVKALKFEPGDADLLAAIGQVHQYQRNDEFAVRAYSLALDARPDFVDVIETRGLILLRHDKADEARADFVRAVELDPARWRAHNGLGLIADRAGRHAEARLHYDRALDLNPGSGEVLNNRGYSHFLAGDEQAAEADLESAAHIHGHRQAWVNLGSLYARQGRYDRAVGAFGEVLPESEAFNKVAEACMQKGDYATAETLLEQAIRFSPTYFPAAENNLAQLRQQTAALEEE